MFSFYFISAVIVLTAAFAYLNKKFIKLPATIGLMFLSTAFSLVLIIINYFSPEILQPILKAINELDFSIVVIDIMLCFLLFAGAMHTDYEHLRRNKTSIIVFSFFSVIISTFLIGTALFYVSKLFGNGINYLYSLLFGALISPTDPIAVLGILTKAKVPKTAEINIVGESLFNDGIGVVVFISLLTIINSGIETVAISDVVLLFFREALGGVFLGLIIGYIIFLLVKSIDDYETEVIITLAAVLGGNWLAQSIHVSGPLSMVVAGLMTGYKSKKQAMSHITQVYLDKFWHLMDVLMTAILFVLIGLKILSIQYEWRYLWVALTIIPILLICRYISLIIPFLIFRKWVHINLNTLTLMTWGGLKGGLSIAMALSLPNSVSVKNEIVFITYIAVFFSIFVQGLTVERLAKKMYLKK